MLCPKVFRQICETSNISSLSANSAGMGEKKTKTPFTSSPRSLPTRQNKRERRHRSENRTANFNALQSQFEKTVVSLQTRGRLHKA